MTSQNELIANISPEIDSLELSRLIERALAEDISTGDITGESIVPANAVATASLVLKEPAVIAGLKVFEMVMRKCDPRIVFEARLSDSERIAQAPSCMARMEGNARALLAAERTALNIIQRLCGIATFTREFTELAAPHRIEILDTRKTTPGLRMLEKWAVKLGGGTNHRFGLYDAILIKDNHRAIAGGVVPAVERARKNKPNTPIEVEVNSIEQLKEALALKVERVMLDNMSPEQVKQAVTIAAGRTYIEVSGGVNLGNITDYLIAGVNGISIGALTHSVKNIDISLEFEDFSHDKH
jgi:nicotinate-nucleotide pyrophosphorylase (carboxylating)